MQKEIEVLRPKLKEILYDCAVEIRATKAALYLYDGMSRYDLAASYGFKVPIREWADKNDPIVDRCGRGRNPFIINGLAEEPRFSELMYESQTDRMFVYPIWMRGSLIGLIDMRDKAAKHLFDPTDIPKATIIADRIIELFSDKNVFKQRYISLSEEEKLPGEGGAELRPRTVDQSVSGAHAAMRPAPEPARPSPPTSQPSPATLSRATSNSFMPSLQSLEPPGPSMPSLSSIAPQPPPSTASAPSAPSAPSVQPVPQRPLAAVPPPPAPMPEPPSVALPVSSHVPRASAIVIEARAACGELMAKKSDDVFTDTEMTFVRESLKATLGIPGAVVAMFSAFGHLGGVQEVASRTQVSAEGVKFLQSRLHIWLSKRGETAGITRTTHMQPLGPPGPPVEVTQMQKVFTAPVTAGSLTGLYLTVAFSDAPDRYAHEFLAENLNQLQVAIEQSFNRTTLQRMRLRAAERLLEPQFNSYPELKRHTEIVVDLADRFAREVDLPPRETEQLHLLAMVVGSSRVDLQACKLEYSIVSPK